MSMTKAAVLATTTSSMSLIVGLYAGFYLTNRRVTDQYETILEEQVRQAKAFYSQRNKTGEYADPVALAEKFISDEKDSNDEDDLVVVDQTGIRPADPEDILNKQDPEDRVNYNKFSENYRGPAVERETYSRSSLQPGPNESIEEFEQRVQDEAKARVLTVVDKSGETELAKEVIEVEETTTTSNIFDTNKVEPLEHEMKRNRDVSRPYIVTQAEFEENMPEHMQTTITYYQGDNTITDEKEQPIDDLEGVVGSANLLFGNGSADPNIVYVRNETMEIDFEVCLDPGTYVEEVLGEAPRSRGPRPI